MVCCIVRKLMQITAKRVILTSFFVDILDVILNVAVAILSGSVVMVAQALEGGADLASSGLLLVGLERSEQPPDKRHPFGYGRELYFWTMLAALLMFTLTAGLSFYFGWQRFFSPQPIENLFLTYFVLSLSIFTNGYSFSLSTRRLVGQKDLGRIWRIFFHTGLVETKATFILDLMGTLASILGLIALAIFGITGDLRFDGLGAMVIGVMLAVLSYFLMLGVKDLVVGRSAPAEVEGQIRQAAVEVKGVKEVLDLRTMLIGPERLLVNLEVHMEHKLSTKEIEALIDKVKERVKEKVPTVQHIQVELETPDEELAKK